MLVNLDVALRHVPIGEPISSTTKPVSPSTIISGTEPHGKRFIVKADDLLTAFLPLERDAIVPKGANENGTENVA